MTEQPLVSIIIPTYNRAHLIRETLDSVLAQTYTNWECIVVDDGSTDETDALMKSYCEKDARFQYHHRPADRLPGGNAARNYGFEVSKGNYINWFDSDDLMFEEKIACKIETILNAKADIVICKGAIFEKLPDIEFLAWPLHLRGNTLHNHVCGKIAFVTNGPLFKRRFLLKNMPLFDESLVIRQEWEFFNRLLCDNPQIKIIRRPLYFFRNLKTGIRGKIDASKIKCQIKAERLTFKYLKNTNLMTESEKFLYRKIVIRRCIDFYKSFQFRDKFKESFTTFYTIFLVIDFKFIKLYLKEKVNSLS